LQNYEIYSREDLILGIRAISTKYPKKRWFLSMFHGQKGSSGWLSMSGSIFIND
jgi:hypothetical protein